MFHGCLGKHLLLPLSFHGKRANYKFSRIFLYLSFHVINHLIATEHTEAKELDLDRIEGPVRRADNHSLGGDLTLGRLHCF